MPLTKVKLKIKPEEIPKHRPAELTEAPPPVKPSEPEVEEEVALFRRLIEGEAPTVLSTERAAEELPAPAEQLVEKREPIEPLAESAIAQSVAPLPPTAPLSELQPLEAQQHRQPEPQIPAVPESLEPRVVEVRTIPVEPVAEHRRHRAAFKRVWRVPRLRLRDSSRLEGAELPLPPMEGGRPVRTPSGYIVIGDGVVRVYAEKEGPWGPLQPLVEHEGTQEIFVRELDGEVHITAGIEGRRYVVELPRELLVERLVQHIAIEAGIPLSERNPQDSGEFRGWRVNLALPQLAGGWQLAAARVVRVEPFRAEPLLLARLVALAASPNSITFVGPPGSGKTTALIGVLNTVLAFWPRLRVSIVEEEAEVATQVRGPNVVSYFSFGDRTVTANIRATRRYDRPDILVVGELRGEEVPSWFEAAGSGIPVLTTAHSRELGDALKRLNTLIQASGLQASVIDAVRVWVVCGKTVSSEGGIQRGVQAVYVVDARGFVPIYKADKYLPEEDFLKLLPPELQLSLENVSEAEKVYEIIKGKLGAGIGDVKFERMEPLLPEEVAL